MATPNVITLLGRSTLLLGLVLGAGCYTGLDGPSAQDNDDAGDAGDAGGPNDPDDPGSRAPDGEDPSAEDEPPFNVPTDEAKLLPFPVRMANLAHVTGQDPGHPMFLEMLSLRYQLGDHDYATGVAPDLRWSAERMQYWVRGLQPVCQSAEVQAAYPELVEDPRPLMRQAWGREPADEEVEALADIRSSGLDDATQFTMTCMAVLTALDFVSM